MSKNEIATSKPAQKKAGGEKPGAMLRWSRSKSGRRTLYVLGLVLSFLTGGFFGNIPDWVSIYRDISGEEQEEYAQCIDSVSSVGTSLTAKIYELYVLQYLAVSMPETIEDLSDRTFSD